MLCPRVGFGCECCGSCVVHIHDEVRVALDHVVIQEVSWVYFSLFVLVESVVWVCISLFLLTMISSELSKMDRKDIVCFCELLNDKRNDGWA